MDAGTSARIYDTFVLFFRFFAGVDGLMGGHLLFYLTLHPCSLTPMTVSPLDKFNSGRLIRSKVV